MHGPRGEVRNRHIGESLLHEVSRFGLLDAILQRAECDVLLHGRGQQLVFRILQQQTYLSAPSPHSGAGTLSRGAFQIDLSVANVLGSTQQQQQCRLTRSVGTKQGDARSGRRGEVDVADRPVSG